MNVKIKIMKNLKKHITLLFFVCIALSCSEEKLIDDIYDQTTRGLVLRTVAQPTATFDFFDPTASWVTTLEVQDEENGALLSDIDIYITFVDDGDAGTETLLKTVDASTFSPGPFGLPRGDISITLNEALAALGLVDGDYDSADSFNVRLVANLTDGRSFTSNANGTVTGGSFFSSPFAYSVQFFCPLDDASAFDGNYVIVVDAWEDYAAGNVIPVEFVSEYTFRILSTNNPYIANTDTAYIEITIDPSDGTATGGSNEPFDYGVPIDVEVDGSVGTCTGDVNVTLTFVGYGDYAFSIVKQ
ncbi:hypothetical protein [Flagellimonas iocasae]|uniref:DUF1735 domain-containing protein n=1 Tax=Flagellimonas iocasae TaxID=2055905 RepID=A0ABW4Y1L1_9FLAO